MKSSYIAYIKVMYNSYLCSLNTNDTTCQNCSNDSSRCKVEFLSWLGEDAFSEVLSELENKYCDECTEYWMGEYDLVKSERDMCRKIINLLTDEIDSIKKEEAIKNSEATTTRGDI